MMFESEISCEWQMTIRLNVQDQLSQRNNAALEDWTSYKSDALPIELTGRTRVQGDINPYPAGTEGD